MFKTEAPAKSICDFFYMIGWYSDNSEKCKVRLLGAATGLIP